MELYKTEEPKSLVFVRYQDDDRRQIQRALTIEPAIANSAFKQVINTLASSSIRCAENSALSAIVPLIHSPDKPAYRVFQRVFLGLGDKTIGAIGENLKKKVLECSCWGIRCFGIKGEVGDNIMKLVDPKKEQADSKKVVVQACEEEHIKKLLEQKTARLGENDILIACHFISCLLGHGEGEKGAKDAKDVKLKEMESKFLNDYFSHGVSYDAKMEYLVEFIKGLKKLLEEGAL